jgi:hypothetical protein
VSALGSSLSDPLSRTTFPCHCSELSIKGICRPLFTATLPFKSLAIETRDFSPAIPALFVDYISRVVSSAACTTNWNYILSVSVPPLATATADPVACNGGTTTVTVTAMGGTGPYQFTDHGDTPSATDQVSSSFSTFSGKSASSTPYVFTVTDANGRYTPFYAHS